MEHEEKDSRPENTMANDKVKVLTSTKRGDRGQTSLLSGERVSKSDPRIEVGGNLDESNAALGLAKAFTENERIRAIISTIQKDLLLLGSEFSSTDPARLVKRIEAEHTSQIEKWIEDLQKEVPLARHFIDPGANPVSAALDSARAIVRRTERSMVILQEEDQVEHTEALKYINRLAFLLYTLARYAEKR